MFALWRFGPPVAAPGPLLDRFCAAMRPVTTPLPLIRCGGEADGGYLLPDDLEGIAACFSPGVAEAASFELDMARRGIPCFLADASVDGPPLQHELFRFEKTHLSCAQGAGRMTLDGWMERCAPKTGDLLLQMDIEGAEYKVLAAAPRRLLLRLRIIVLELHTLEQCFTLAGLARVRAALDPLLQAFHVLHLHPNNSSPVARSGRHAMPAGLELTLLRRDRAPATGYATRFPHPLDRRNVPDRPELLLPGCWRESPPR